MQYFTLVIIFRINPTWFYIQGHMDMMKETEYCKKVQQVLEFLQSPNCHVHDDTLYYKLLDSLSIKGKWIVTEQT